MPKLIFLTILISLVGVSSYGQKRNDVVTFSKENGSHKVKLLFRTKPFVAKQHKIKNVTDEKSAIQGTWIDGKFALGTDLSIPNTEIASIKLYFDEKEVLVPPNLFSDCYDPNLGKDYFWLKFGDDGKSVMAFMAGSDAAGSYQVFWIFRSDGKHSRFTNKVSDANPFDFAKWFFDQ